MLLLVSVMNAEEAEEAVNGGADILDIKNPREGSLGAAHPKLISELCHQFSQILPVSAAVGDFPHLPNAAALAALCAADIGADYIKIGLLGSQSERQAFDLLTNVKDTLAWRGSSAKLIAAVYADYREAGTLEPRLLPAVASRANVAGCMIDTLNKKGTSLFDYLDSEILREFIGECSRYDLLSALAGSLKLCHVGSLNALRPDIVGVRGAVCQGGIRAGCIDHQKVAEFRLNLADSNQKLAMREGVDGWLPTR
jgi:uncharacterized protein (UPF0264 family)